MDLTARSVVDSVPKPAVVDGVEQRGEEAADAGLERGLRPAGGRSSTIGDTQRFHFSDEIMSARTLTVGIADYDRMKARTIAIAGGRHSSDRGEPTMCFTSVESLDRVFSRRNRKLLASIAHEKPGLIVELTKRVPGAASRIFCAHWGRTRMRQTDTTTSRIRDEW